MDPYKWVYIYPLYIVKRRDTIHTHTYTPITCTLATKRDDRDVLIYHGIFLCRYRWRSTSREKTSNSSFDPTDFYMELATHLYEQGH